MIGKTKAAMRQLNCAQQCVWAHWKGFLVSSLIHLILSSASSNSLYFTYHLFSLSLRSASAVPYQSKMAEVEVCEFCRVKLRTLDPRPANSRQRRNIDDHIELFLLPQSLHDSLVDSGLYTREQCNTPVAACYICATAATRSFTDQERAKYLNTSIDMRYALQALGYKP